jgi:hypothetical protein
MILNLLKKVNTTKSSEKDIVLRKIQNRDTSYFEKYIVIIQKILNSIENVKIVQNDNSISFNTYLENDKKYREEL